MKRFKKGDLITMEYVPGRVYEGHVTKRLWRWYGGFDYEVWLDGLSDGFVGDWSELEFGRRTMLAKDEELIRRYPDKESDV